MTSLAPDPMPPATLAASHSMKRYLLRNPRGLQRRKAMNVIMVGCEFAGKTTLADLIVEWCERSALC